MSFWYAVFNYFNHKKHKVTQNSHLSSFIVHRSSFITHLSPRLPSFITLNSSLLVLNSITVVCILLVLPAAMSRASWLAALGGCAFTGILYGTQNKTITDCYKKYRKTIILFSFVAFILLAISMTGLFLLKKNSASGRAFTWKIAIRTIKEHPMGVGLGHFGGAYGDEQAKYFASEAGAIWEKHVAEGVEYAFNEYLQICIETGIVSFLAFIAFVIRTLFIGIKNKNYIPAGSLVSLLIFAAMSYPFNVLPFVIAFMFLSALCLSDNLGQSEQTKHLYQKFAVWAFILIAPVTITLCSHKIYLSYEAYRQWKITQLLHDLEEYAKQYPYLQDNIVFCFGYAQSLSKSGKYEESNKIINNAIKISCDPMFYNIMGKNYHALKKYGLAEQCLKKAANIAPNRLYPHYLLAKLYHEMGLAKKMEKEINIVLTTTPKIDSKAIEEMKEELVKLRDER
ncbi:MAG: O-antigen ligase family protein [Prevotellaceae bacterium]|nr:O-antigen ligase family protein [Prevotellaceae bacterium]